MSSADDLARNLERIDGRGYRAYKDLAGRHALGDLELFLDHVQGDPFAAPSKLRVRVPMRRAALPAELFQTPVRRLALSDFLARCARDQLEDRGKRGEGSGRSGLVYVDAHSVPINRLHAEDYPSVGCAPCSRAVLAGEDSRSGRWWWERPETRECGIHVDEEEGSGI